jgi:dTDP-4-dehydrorhamnose 3,5-epimerase
MWGSALENMDVALQKVHFHPKHTSEDKRGTFSKGWSHQNCLECLTPFKPMEMFWSTSYQGTIRGFHFFPSSSGLSRLINIIFGTIRDITFDITKKNREFCDYTLTPHSDSLLVPSNFAHGFEVLSDTATVLYLTNQLHDQTLDKGINWRVFQDWNTQRPIVSERDDSLPTHSEGFYQ